MRKVLSLILAGSLVLAACGSDETATSAGQVASGDAPVVIATTSVWGDVLSNISCGAFSVEALLPPNADPHSYEPSLRDREDLGNAALVVSNGLNLEESLEDTLGAVAGEGTTVFEVASVFDTLDYDEGEGHDDHDDHGDDHDDKHADEHDDHADEHDDHADEHDDHADEHADEHDDHADEHADEHDDHDDHADEHAHDHGSTDPHIWMDPARMSAAIPAMQSEVVSVLQLDAEAASSVEQCASDYAAELAELDAEISETLRVVPEGKRHLVTNHDALRYFADSYDFEVVGTVIPSTSTLAETTPAQIESLTELTQDLGVPAIFAEGTGSTEDLDAIADRIGSVDVRNLFIAVGGEGDEPQSYIDMMRTNAKTIADSLS